MSDTKDLARAAAEKCYDKIEHDCLHIRAMPTPAALERIISEVIAPLEAELVALRKKVEFVSGELDQNTWACGHGKWNSKGDCVTCLSHAIDYLNTELAKTGIKLTTAEAELARVRQELIDEKVNCPGKRKLAEHAEAERELVAKLIPPRRETDNTTDDQYYRNDGFNSAIDEFEERLCKLREELNPTPKDDTN